MMMLKAAFGMTLLISLSFAFDGTRAQPDMAKRGRVLMSGLCGACHAIGTTGASRHAGAPAFRELGDRIELDTFSDRLRDGLQSTHADMPSFRFSRDDARAVIAYLRALQSP
jgi:mono/diheme cytochrome c family protein